MSGSPKPPIAIIGGPLDGQKLALPAWDHGFGYPVREDGRTVCHLYRQDPTRCAYVYEGVE